MLHGRRTREFAAVVDSSALIVVAKIDALGDWNRFYNHLYIPPAVEEECIGEPILPGREDVLRIRNALKGKVLERLALTDTQQSQAMEWHNHSPLGMGECETLASVYNSPGTIAIVEDKRARSFARTHQIAYTTIQMCPLEGYIRKEILYPRAAELVDQVAMVMHTDLALLSALQLALGALARERGEIDDRTEE